MTTPIRPEQVIPPGIKDPTRWLQRRAERAERRPRLVNYPVLAPGEAAIGLRKKHGVNNVKITRETHAAPSSKYAPKP